MDASFSETDDAAVVRLIRSTLERHALDGWTAAGLASRSGLPVYQVRRALDHLAGRGLVELEDGEYRALGEV